MSDIDFDELDRAVNGAIGKSPASKRAPRTEVQERLPANEPDETAEEPMYSEAPAEHLNVASVPSAPRPSSGRFMDMVHPSSDMRTKSADIPSGRTPLSESAPAVDATATPETAWNEPIESPFLPDTKVEKRPLGGVGVPAEPKEELLEAPEEQDLLPATIMPDPIDFAAATQVTEEIETKLEEPEVTSIPEPVAEEPVGPTSITPQYKEQPSSNQESGAIYDTESYHQPVAQPAKVKKKSGWLTIVWILLLVALGAAAGWAVYTYILPTL